MSFVIRATPIAREGANSLRGAPAEAYESKLRDVKSRGCAAFEYRLTGDVVDRICSARLWGDYRLLAAFPDRQTVVVLLVGRHDRSQLDVYNMLCDLLEISHPSEKRTKPPCCENGEFPVSTGLVAIFEGLAEPIVRDLRRTIRRRA